jgi:hypothetical protein
LNNEWRLNWLSTPVWMNRSWFSFLLRLPGNVTALRMNSDLRMDFLHSLEADSRRCACADRGYTNMSEQ